MNTSHIRNVAAILTLFGAMACAPRLVKVEYLRLKNITRYETRYQVIMDELYPIHKLQIKVSKVCEGNNTNCIPDQYILTFLSEGYTWFHDHEYARQLMFFTDSVKIDMGIAVQADISSATPERVTEWLLSAVPPEFFPILADSQVLTGTLGSVEFDIPYEERAAWREMIPSLSEPESVE